MPESWDRTRARLELTLSPEAIAALTKLAKFTGESRSRVVDRLVLAAYASHMRRRKRTA